MQENLFLLDSDKTILGVLSNRMPFSLSFTEDLQERSLDDFTDTLTFKIPANHNLSAQVKADRYILYPEYSGGQKLYKIMEVNEVSSDGIYTREVYAEISAQDDLLKSIVRPMQFSSASLKEVLEYILTGTDWEVGEVDSLGLLDYVIEDYPTALDAVISAIQEFGGELNFEYETLNNSASIVSQKVSAYKQLGEQTNKIFTHGKDLQGVERFEDTTKLVTAMIGVGKSDDNGIPLNFKTTNLTIPTGYEKPFEADWVSSTKALEEYSSDGKHTFGIYRDDDADSAHELFKRTLEALKKYEKPLVTYKVDVALLERVSGYEHMSVKIGDSIVVQDKTVTPELYVKARVRKLSRSLTNPINDAVELGDYIPVVPSTNKLVTELQTKIRASEATWTEARRIAEEAQVTATEADSKATLADGKATTAQATADAVKGTADTAKATADEAKATADAVAGQVTTVEEDLADKIARAEYDSKMAELNTELEAKTGFAYVDGQLVAKADQTAVDAINTELADKADLTYVDGQLVAKADKASTFTKTEVNNALAGKVSTTTYTTDQDAVVTRLSDAETAISQNDSEIALKASKTDLDAVEGRVTDAEASITVQAGQIASKVSTSTYQAEAHVWEQAHSVNTATPAILKEKDGTDILPSYIHSYKVEARIGATGSNTGAIAYFRAGGATGTPVFTLDKVFEKGTNSNQIEFFLNEDGKPCVRLYDHTSKYGVYITTTKFAGTTSETIELGGRVSTAESTITQLDDEIKSKVSTTDFNTLSGRVSTAESTITQHSNQIASKVATTDFNTLTGRVSTAESTITQQAGQISSRVEKNKVVSEINQSSETIKISANKIDITGAVTFSSFADSEKKLFAGGSGIVNINPYFADWTNSLPYGVSVWSGVSPAKYTSDTMNGGNGLRFTCSDTEDGGVSLNSYFKVLPNNEYYTVEIDFKLLSGASLSGAGFLLDWRGLSSYRQQINLNDEITNPETGKWYTVRKVLKRADTSGTYSYMGGYLMANWSGAGAKTAKDIVYDRVEVRVSTQQEVDIYNGKPNWDYSLDRVNTWKHPSNSTLINGGKIYTNSITATQINVSSLSALSANIGTVTAGTVTGVSFSSKPLTLTDPIGRKWTENTEIGINGVGFRTSATVQTSTNSGYYANQETVMDNDGILISTRDDSNGLYSFTSMSGSSIQFGGQTSNLVPYGQHFIYSDGELSLDANKKLSLQSMSDEVVIESASGKYIRLNGTVSSQGIYSTSTVEAVSLKGSVEHSSGYFLLNPYSSSYVGTWIYGQLFFDGNANSWKFNSRQSSGSLSTTKLVAGGFETSSSIEFKENIGEFSVDALEVINSLSVHTYNYIGSDPTEKKIGLIIEDGVPEPISNKTGEAVDTYAMASYLWKAVQQLSNQVEYQQQSIDYLTAQVESHHPETV